jgi:hypothetical protein
MNSTAVQLIRFYRRYLIYQVVEYIINAKAAILGFVYIIAAT